MIINYPLLNIRTTFCANTYGKSVAYAEMSYTDGLPHPDHLIWPRSTGLYTCASNLMPKNPVMWDMTLAIAGTTGHHTPAMEEVYSLGNTLWYNQAASEIHIRIERIACSDIEPLSRKITNEHDKSIAKNDFEVWLRTRWHAKDKTLASFYKDKKKDFGDSDGWKTWTCPKPSILEMMGVGFLWIASLYIVTWLLWHGIFAFLGLYPRAFRILMRAAS